MLNAWSSSIDEFGQHNHLITKFPVKYFPIVIASIISLFNFPIYVSMQKVGNQWVEWTQDEQMKFEGGKSRKDKAML